MTEFRTPRKLKPNGGWKDERDIELCKFDCCLVEFFDPRFDYRMGCQLFQKNDIGCRLWITSD